MKPVSKTLRERLESAHSLERREPSIKVGSTRMTKDSVESFTSSPASFTAAEMDDPRVIELGRQMIAAVKQQAQNERDVYRELLEARVAGLEALLTVIVRQMPAHDDPLVDQISKPLRDNIERAKSYLAGHGNL